MTDLLQELETSAPLTESLISIEDYVREATKHVPQVGLAVQGMKGSALVFENAWRRIILHVANGRTSEIQAARQQFLSAFGKRLSLLRDTYNLGKWLAALGTPAVPEPEVLLPEIRQMERLQERVFDRWQTADDLEDLAARDYPLTMADLDRIGPSRRPPPSYYAEETRPF